MGAILGKSFFESQYYSISPLYPQDKKSFLVSCSFKVNLFSCLPLFPCFVTSKKDSMFSRLWCGTS